MEAQRKIDERLKLLYEQLCTNIRTTDEISFRLLGLVPLVSGAGITLLISTDVFLDVALATFAGIFGAAVTVALLMWDLRNIGTCKYLIETACVIERDAFGLERGQFVGRPDAGSFYRLRRGKTEAVKFIYSATILAWLALPVVASWQDV